MSQKRHGAIALCPLNCMICESGYLSVSDLEAGCLRELTFATAGMSPQMVIT